MKKAIRILLTVNMIMGYVALGAYALLGVLLVFIGEDAEAVGMGLGYLFAAPLYIVIAIVSKNARARLETATCKKDMLGYAIFDLIAGCKVAGILMLVASDDVYAEGRAQNQNGYYYQNYQNPYDPYSGYYQNPNNQQPYGNNQQPYGNNQQPYGNNQQPYGNNQQPYGNGQQPYNGYTAYGNTAYGNNYAPYGNNQPQNADVPEEKTENTETQGENTNHETL